MVAIAGTGWKLAPSLVAYVLEADRYYPQRDRSADGSIGDLAHQARVSDHNPVGGLVHAVDLDEDLAPGLDMDGFAEKLRARRDPRVKYVIYEGRMFSSYGTTARAPWEWGPYSGVNAHEHHLHLSILDDWVAERDTGPWGFAPAVAPVPAPPPEPEDADSMFTYEYLSGSTNVLVLVAGGKQSRITNGEVRKRRAAAVETHLGLVDRSEVDLYRVLYGPVHGL